MWYVSPVLSFARSTLENLCAKTAGSWNHNVFPSVMSQWAVTHHWCVYLWPNTLFSGSNVSFWVNYCESSLLPSGMKNKDLTKTNWSSWLDPFVVGDPYNGIPSHSMKWKWQLTAKVHFARWLSPLWIATRGCRCQCRLDSFQSDRETHLPEMISQPCADNILRKTLRVVSFFNFRQTTKLGLSQIWLCRFGVYTLSNSQCKWEVVAVWFRLQCAMFWQYTRTRYTNIGSFLTMWLEQIRCSALAVEATVPGCDQTKEKLRLQQETDCCTYNVLTYIFLIFEVHTHTHTKKTPSVFSTPQPYQQMCFHPPTSAITL